MAELATSSGVTIHYREAGAGPPLVLLHGWLMSERVWHFQEGLAGGCRLIAVDLRGHGRSQGGDIGYGLGAFAADLVELFERLDLERAVLLGWSLGAQVALFSASSLAERLAGLVLVGGTPRFCAAPDYPHGLPPVEARGMGLRLKRNFLGTAGDFFSGMFAPGELARREMGEIARAVAGRLPELPAALASLESLATADLRPLLPGVRVPALLVHGTADTICIPGASRYMADRLPAAELRLLEGLGHAPFLSRPAEFNAIVEDFFHRVTERH